MTQKMKTYSVENAVQSIKGVLSNISSEIDEKAVREFAQVLIDNCAQLNDSLITNPSDAILSICDIILLKQEQKHLAKTVKDYLAQCAYVNIKLEMRFGEHKVVSKINKELKSFIIIQASGYCPQENGSFFIFIQDKLKEEINKSLCREGEETPENGLKLNNEELKIILFREAYNVFLSNIFKDEKDVDKKEYERRLNWILRAKDQFDPRRGGDFIQYCWNLISRDSKDCNEKYPFFVKPVGIWENNKTKEDKETDEDEDDADEDEEKNKKNLTSEKVTISRETYIKSKKEYTAVKAHRSTTLPGLREICIRIDKKDTDKTECENNKYNVYRQAIDFDISKLANKDAASTLKILYDTFYFPLLYQYSIKPACDKATCKFITALFEDVDKYIPQEDISHLPFKIRYQDRLENCFTTDLPFEEQVRAFFGEDYKKAYDNLFLKKFLYEKLPNKESVNLERENVFSLLMMFYAHFQSELNTIITKENKAFLGDFYSRIEKEVRSAFQYNYFVKNQRVPSQRDTKQHLENHHLLSAYKQRKESADLSKMMSAEQIVALFFKDEKSQQDVDVQRAIIAKFKEDFAAYLYSETVLELKKHHTVVFCENYRDKNAKLNIDKNALEGLFKKSILELATSIEWQPMKRAIKNEVKNSTIERYALENGGIKPSTAVLKKELAKNPFLKKVEQADGKTVEDIIRSIDLNEQESQLIMQLLLEENKSRLEKTNKKIFEISTFEMQLFYDDDISYLSPATIRKKSIAFEVRTAYYREFKAFPTVDEQTVYIGVLNAWDKNNREMKDDDLLKLFKQKYSIKFEKGPSSKKCEFFKSLIQQGHAHASYYESYVYRLYYQGYFREKGALLREYEDCYLRFCNALLNKKEMISEKQHRVNTERVLNAGVTSLNEKVSDSNDNKDDATLEDYVPDESSHKEYFEIERKEINKMLENEILQNNYITYFIVSEVLSGIAKMSKPSKSHYEKIFEGIAKKCSEFNADSVLDIYKSVYLQYEDKSIVELQWETVKEDVEKALKHPEELNPLQKKVMSGLQSAFTMKPDFKKIFEEISQKRSGFDGSSELEAYKSFYLQYEDKSIVELQWETVKEDVEKALKHPEEMNPLQKKVMSGLHSAVAFENVANDMMKTIGAIADKKIIARMFYSLYSNNKKKNTRYDFD